MMGSQSKWPSQESVGTQGPKVVVMGPSVVTVASVISAVVTRVVGASVDTTVVSSLLVVGATVVSTPRGLVPSVVGAAELGAADETTVVPGPSVVMTVVGPTVVSGPSLVCIVVTTVVGCWELGGAMVVTTVVGRPVMAVVVSLLIWQFTPLKPVCREKVWKKYG